MISDTRGVATWVIFSPLASTAQSWWWAVEASGDRGVGGVNRGDPGRRGGLHPEGWHLREAEPRGDQRGVVALPGELLGVHGRDHQRVGPLDARVGQGGQRRLGHEVGEILVAPSEAGHARPGDPHVGHGPISTGPRAGVNGFAGGPRRPLHAAAAPTAAGRGSRSHAHIQKYSILLTMYCAWM